MVPKYTIAAFRDVDAPITQPVTKFGGQPVWLMEPQWPVSRSTGEPMRFLCQIALDEQIFGNLAGRMAYIFLTENEAENKLVDNTWDPVGGENAVIIQPGGASEVETRPLVTGPSLYKYVWDPPAPERPGVPVPVELAVQLKPDHDPDVLDEDLARSQGNAALDAYFDRVNEDKIGGTPAFLQYPEYPLGSAAKLLLQLNAPENAAFSVNFGDAGVAYAFISEDGTRGKFLWQCA